MSPSLILTYFLACANASRLPLLNKISTESWSGSGDLMSTDMAKFLLFHHRSSGDTPEEFPWEFPEFQQYKNHDFVFDYDDTPVIYAFWTAGYKLKSCNQAIISYQKSKNELEKTSLLETCRSACADFDSSEKYHTPKNCTDPESLPIFEKHHPWLSPFEWWVYDHIKNGDTDHFVPPGPPGTLDHNDFNSSSSHNENPNLNGTEHSPIRINKEIIHETQTNPDWLKELSYQRDIENFYKEMMFEMKYPNFMDMHYNEN